ncbi:hypothetical protein IWQ49_006672 [Labrenzia sp. EL_126]|nr:hypothetical protein [Labrenzia sp. EL_126]
MSANFISVRSQHNGRKITTSFDMVGEWQDALDASKKSAWWKSVSGDQLEFFTEYFDDTFACDEAVANIPFVTNVAPLVFLCDADLHVDTIDEHFLQSLNFLRTSYARMYPHHKWSGRIHASNVVYNHIGSPHSNSIVLFSGGVDAVFTALANIAIEPTLVTVWGADIFFGANNGWEKTNQANQEFADRFGLEYVAIKSNFRTVLNYSWLDPKFGKPVRDNWWHAFQFGTALSGLTLPLALHRKSDTIYLASDYSYKDPRILSASDPTLVQEIRASGAFVKCHDYSASRQDKLQFICDFTRRYEVIVPLRVCWKSQAGENCGVCDKCMRTTFGILACDSDPADFTFDFSDEAHKKIIESIKSGTVSRNVFWKEIVHKLRDSKFKSHVVVQELFSFFDD